MIDIFRDQEEIFNLATSLFYLAWREFVREADELLATRGLSRVHHRLLFVIARRPGLNIGEICDVMGVSRQAMHRPLKQLQQEELVEARVSPQSARQRLLYPLEAGLALEAELNTLQSAMLEQVVEEVGEEAVRGWASVMWALARPAMGRSEELRAFMVGASEEEPSEPGQS